MRRSYRVSLATVCASLSTLVTALLPLTRLETQEAAASYEAHELEVEGRALRYRLLSPEGLEEGKTYPLVLFLHGAGERGDDNEKQLEYLPEAMAREPYRSEYRAFVLAPQLPPGEAWSTQLHRPIESSPLAPPNRALRSVETLLAHTLLTRPIDRRRVYLTGLSMGGYGSWELACHHPDLFAAVAPICGGGDPTSAWRLRDTPVWAIHGTADNVIPVLRSRSMIEALRAADAHPEYTEFDGVGHNSWTPAYAEDSALLPWMFRQSLDFDPILIASKEGLAALAAESSPIRIDDRIAFFGDSITQAGVKPGGYVHRIGVALDQQYPSVQTIGAGISGHKVPDLEARFQRDIVEKKPTVVFVYIGINDVWHGDWGKGTPSDVFEAGLLRLVDAMKARGMTVVLATPSVIGEKSDGTNRLDAQLETYAAITRGVARRRQLELCDLRRAFITHLKRANPEQKEKGILTTDGVHLNAAGNEFVAQEAAASLVSALHGRR